MIIYYNPQHCRKAFNRPCHSSLFLNGHFSFIWLGVVTGFFQASTQMHPEANVAMLPYLTYPKRTQPKQASRERRIVKQSFKIGSDAL
jgi:hypothetical protein